jgi:NADP-dependent aldehyde dehydrogenase
MTFTPHGQHIIAGERIGGHATFRADPVEGSAHDVAMGDAALVDRACMAAEDAFATYGASSRADRAAFLNAIADEVDARGDAITEIGTRETGLPAARLTGERGRTVGQLRMFADHILKGDYLDRRHDPALPDRAPAPRPDLRMMQRPIGPVAVFGASNFPLAFSTAGGDTASALAAGCPVVVKGHEAHPGTAEIVAEAIAAAAVRCGMPAGVFSLIHGGSHEVGAALVQHPLIRAVGFTGSLTMGAGQFCTNPGIAVALDGPHADTFIDAARAALADSAPQTMLTDGIAAAYGKGCDRVAAVPGVASVLTPEPDARRAAPALFVVSGADWLAAHALGEEVFGPLGLVVRAQGADEMLAIARALDGQLTATLHMDDADTDAARRLMPVLERKAGRLLVNGFPTGVEVCDAMVHGGPYPASTNFGATSVGTLAIRRFLRPVCYQNMPDALLPEDLAG